MAKTDCIALHEVRVPVQQINAMASTPREMPTPRRTSLSLNRHANLLQQFLAVFLDQIRQVRQGLAFRLRFLHGRDPAWEAVEHAERIQRTGSRRACLPLFSASANGLLLPVRKIIFRPHQDQVIDDGGSRP